MGRKSQLPKWTIFNIGESRGRYFKSSTHSRIPVIFGRRPYRQGFWEGRLELTGEYTEVKKLRAPSFENGIGFGVEIGSIKDFESMGGAILFMAVDRQMYYTDRDGWFDQDEFGRYCYRVLGPYDFRSLCRDKVLDPLPRGPAIVWGSGKEGRENYIVFICVMYL